MTKLIALSGAQGGGKSTLLLALRDRGWSLDEFRVSRAVQAQLGWDSLDRVMDSVDTMISFQEEVFKQKYEHDLMLSQLDINDTILTERSFADIAAYTTFWCWEHVDRRNWAFGEASIWLTQYLKKCRDAQAIYSGILLLPYMNHIVWQSDPNRAKPASVAIIYEDVRSFAEAKQVNSPPFHEIVSASVDDRVIEVESFLKKL